MKGQNSPFLARLLGIACLLASAYGVLLLSRYTADSTRMASITAFEDAIALGHFEQANNALSFATTLTRLTDRLPLPPLEPHPAEEWSRVLKKSAHYLSEFECLAKPPLQGPKNSHEPCHKKDESTPFTLLHGESGEQYLSFLERIRTGEAEITALREKIAELDRAHESAWRKIDLLRSDYCELFNLNEAIRRELQSGELFLYESGVLAGLPTLPKIEDNLPTYVALAEALKDASLPLPKVSHEQFEAQIFALKDSFSKIIEALDTTGDLRTTFQQRVIKEERKVIVLYEKTRALMQASLNADLKLLRS